jgi:hypothetical protein
MGNLGFTKERIGALLMVLWLLPLPGAIVSAEKEEWYTSSDEFLPLGADGGDESDSVDLSYLEDDTLIHRAELAGIRLLKDEDRLVFTLKAVDSQDIVEKDLKYSYELYNCPPRVVLVLYGVKVSERVYRFFENLSIRGVVLDPFLNGHASRFVIFLNDWSDVTAEYSREQKSLTLRYTAAAPPFRRGYGVRIADTKIDPLPHVIEIKRQLTASGMENMLLVASDEETIVLESPFSEEKQAAIEYIESLETVGFKGKLAIREYREFPKPNRFDVISEVVITGEGDVDLESLVYTELLPERISRLSYSELFLIVKEIFSPRVQNDDELIAEYFYSLSEIYRNYETADPQLSRSALLVSVKLLEIIYFQFPQSQRADDALWEMANVIREHNVMDEIGERECYKKLVKEYPDSIFFEESKARLNASGMRRSLGVLRTLRMPG